MAFVLSIITIMSTFTFLFSNRMLILLKYWPSTDIFIISLNFTITLPETTPTLLAKVTD